MQPDSPGSFVVYVYEGFISLMRSIWWTIRTHLVFFLACILLCGGFMFAQEFKKRNYYEASFTVIYDELVRKIYGDRLSKLNELIQTKEYVKASKLMNTDPGQLESLVEIRGENILGERLTEDLNTDKIPFVVKLVVKDTSIVTPVQNGIMHFLEGSNPYLVSKANLKLESIRTELDFIDRQLALIDSQSRKGGALVLSGGKASATSESGYSNLYAFSYELYQRKQELTKKLEMPAGLHVIDDAIVPVRLGGNLVTNTVIGLVAGVFLFFLIQLFVLPVFRDGKL